MYIVEGLTCEAIAKVLKTEYPKITGVTIRKWADAKNQTNETWDDIKNRKLQLDERRILKTETSKRRILINQVAELQEKMRLQIMREMEEGSAKVSPADLFNFAKFGIALEEQEKQNWNPDGIAEKLLNILYSNKKVKKVLEDNMIFLLPQINALFGKTNVEKEVE